jgi:CheY-specific phosphatase CheX
MPGSEWVGFIQQSVEEVLEVMFLTPVGDEPVEGEVSTPVASTLRFCGTPSGTLQVEVSEDAARELAANFLGDELDAISPERAGEVIGELANMVCGSILSHVPSGTLFELSHPEPGVALTGDCVREPFAIPGGALVVSMQFAG